MSFLVLFASQDAALPQNTPPTREDRAVQTPPSPAELSALQGNWIRPDGGYVIVIRGIDNVGKLDATYFNPNLNPGQLPFARAEAALNGGRLNIFFELRAGGYAGSTYTLTYDPGRDQLSGVYFQAVAQQKFSIVFTRVK
jgi:hypothetical protein